MKFSEYIKDMSLRDKASHILSPVIRSTPQDNADNADKRESFSWIFQDETVHPGVISLFPGKRQDLQDMVKQVNRRSKHPVLVAMDLESGPAGIAEGAKFGSAMAISAAGDPDLAYTAGMAAATEGRAVGVNWTFAPVVDLSINHNNSITNIRAWGDTPERVCEYAIPYIKGVQDHGMIATGKHFPGDGIDDRDQHICTSVNSLSREKWMSTYGKVWKSAIDAGMQAVMPGHIALPAFQENGEIVPATLSYDLCTGLLREKLGFQGLIVTDALNMGGVLSQVSTEECIIGSIKAGADVLLFINFLTEISYAADVVEKAVRDGVISESRLDESIHRIWYQKQRLGLFDAKDGGFIPVTDIHKKRFIAASQTVHERSLTLMKDNGVLPLDKSRVKRIISVDIANNEDSIHGGLEKLMSQNGIDVLKYGDGTDKGIPRVDLLPDADAVFINFYFHTMWGSNYIRPCGKKIQRLYEYFFKIDVPVIVIAYGSPYIAREFSAAKTVINTYSAKNETFVPLYEVVFGNRKAVGECPVKMDNY